MNEQEIVVYKIEQPYTKHIMEVSSTVGVSDIKSIKYIFCRANMIVDAQFYYTNPLMYVFVDNILPDFAKLYENYYLIPPRLYDAIDIDESYVAVNERFIETISSLLLISEKEKSKEALQAPEDQPTYILDSMFTLYQESGLYIIGIEWSGSTPSHERVAR